jgi:hypothetical protein
VRGGWVRGWEVAREQMLIAQSKQTHWPPWQQPALVGARLEGMSALCALWRRMHALRSPSRCQCLVFVLALEGRASQRGRRRRKLATQVEVETSALVCAE